MADAYAKFIFVDVGYNGRLNDAGALQRSSFMHVLDNPDTYLPPKKIVGNERLLPHVFVGDNAFPLLENLVTPYPFTTTDTQKQKFNFRLSRARQNIERAFGILANRFQVLQTAIRLNEGKAIKIVRCCCVLHNFLTTTSHGYSADVDIRPEEEIYPTRESVTSSPRRNLRAYEAFRSSWRQYFNNEGSV